MIEWRDMNLLPEPGERWALFLDVDGTLLDLAPRPDLVRAPAGLPALLERLTRLLDGAVAVVSGRPLHEIDDLLQPWRPTGAGEHGAFCRLPSGAIESPDPPPIPADWRRRVEDFAADHPGMIVEQKASAVSVHYRAIPAVEPKLRQLLQAMIRADIDRFALVSAHMAWELRPRSVDKGAAVRRLMREQPFAGRRPVFVGDDVTDEDGMAAAESLGGIGIHVHERFSEGAAGVRAWLGALAEHVERKEVA